MLAFLHAVLGCRPFSQYPAVFYVLPNLLGVLFLDP